MKLEHGGREKTLWEWVVRPGDDSIGATERLRVASGWLYRVWGPSGQPASVTFVPATSDEMNDRVLESLMAEEAAT